MIIFNIFNQLKYIPSTALVAQWVYPYIVGYCNPVPLLPTAIQCEDGFVYRACVSPCQELQCNDPYNEKPCDLPCVEGCGCREDQVLHKGQSIACTWTTCFLIHIFTVAYPGGVLWCLENPLIFQITCKI